MNEKNTPKTTKKPYEAPEIEVLEVRVEDGFRMSGSDHPLDLPGQDIGTAEEIHEHNWVDF